jgi:uncharacterized protein YcsI (UPF0317 family)
LSKNWDINDPRAVRRAKRSGAHTTHTGALAPGFVQANLMMLPAEDAEDFLRFCQRNPKPCPLLAVSEPGDPTLPELAEALDIRTDVPSYRVFRDGEFVEDIEDISGLWRSDMVVFALGCSYSFEQALIDTGLHLRHWSEEYTVSMYRTNIECRAAGRFHGNMVVSMRPFTPADCIKAIQVTSRYPRVHGAPVHIGKPELIGIEDIESPWQGDRPELADDQLPLFWACGVTPQLVVETTKPKFCITHTPAHMLVTDLTNASLSL